jgi:hypothetical protein
MRERSALFFVRAAALRTIRFFALLMFGITSLGERFFDNL